MPIGNRSCRAALAAFPLLLLIAGPGYSQGNPEWRFWTASDGLAESFVRSVGSGLDGRIYLRHGMVNSISVLDGYRILPLPDMRLTSLVDWGSKSRIYGTAETEAWTLELDRLKRFSEGRWVIAGASPSDPILSIAPQSAGRVFALFSGRLASYDAAHRSWTLIKAANVTGLGRFRQMASGFHGDIWITGSNGVARLEFGDNPAVGRWTEFNARAAGLQNIGSPLPAVGGEVFFVGQKSRGDGLALARWKGPEHEVIHHSWQDNLRGWRGPDGEMWILDGRSLLRSSAGGLQAVPRRGALAGTVHDVLPEVDGEFWIATSEGVGKYTAPLWRTPFPVADIDAAVHAIAEDSQGRIWFAATEHLVELDGLTWRKHRFPAGIRSQVQHTRSALPLPDGRVLIKVQRNDTKEIVLVFAPRTGGFSELTRPDGRAIGLMTPRRDGTFWVRTTPENHFDIWDGHTFRPQFIAPTAWSANDVQCMMEDTDGVLWIGSTLGAAVWSKGVFRPLGPTDGFSDSAALDFLQLRSGQIIVGGRDKLLKREGRHWSALDSVIDRVRKIIETPDGQVWVAAGSGISRLRNGERIPNTEDDGLPSTTVHAIHLDRKGRLWAGTNTGISLYHPEADAEFPLAGFASNGNLRETGPDSDFRILFTGVDKWKATRPRHVLFSYQLDGRNWSSFQAEDFTTLKALSPGSHRLSLRGMDRNGNIQPTSDSFEFTVVLPWYRHAGFVAVLILGGLAIVLLLGFAASNYRQRGLLIAELEVARSTAEAANRQKGQFLANMSHEIRTPMNAVIGMTALAVELARDDEQRNYLNIVQKAANSLLTLLNDILDFSKIEAGKLQLEIADFDLKESIRHVVRLLNVRAQEKGLSVAVNIAPDAPCFLAGDMHRLQQLLFNIVGNAIKFTAEGEVRIDVTLLSQTPHGVTIEFVVRDTGIGVAPGKYRAIFSPFEQEDSSTTRKYGGTGLGLSISAKLVDAMNGKIWIESPWLHPQSGRSVTGSAFHFTLLFQPGKEPAAEPPIDTQPKSGTLRILLAEDNRVNQTLAVRLLERRGHSVLVAANGREAVALWRLERPDLILMDIQMPEMDGFEATAAIRDDEMRVGGHVPIIALTAHAMPGDRERCLSQGMNAYLAKPIRAAELERVISEVADMRRNPPPTPS
jgi:signal transduction histidine kinase/CheY-like chemotaxis protein/ligand-binding sensor domain-containing protein